MIGALSSCPDAAPRSRPRPGAPGQRAALFEEFVRATARHADAATLRGLERRFAERIVQIQPSYWSQIKSRSRQIGERLARQFEHLCHKPRGWMDVPHGPGSEPAARRTPCQPAAARARATPAAETQPAARRRRALHRRPRAHLLPPPPAARPHAAARPARRGADASRPSRRNVNDRRQADLPRRVQGQACARLNKTLASR
jgi:hypothetical protein